ncbi:MAG: hypothetical protein AMS18_12985 [Gemmatimonas sp. SG8_17]|nr:MAG: hypothetical protein AMS18_12985 [Gemmatimonas sp. SG8_17]
MKPVSQAVPGWVSRNGRRLVIAATFALLVVIWVWYTLSPRRGDTMAVLECVQLYAAAVSAADTAAVDEVHPTQGLTQETTCGVLRSEGLLQ